MNNFLTDIPATILGERLRIARDNANITQVEGSKAIEVARTTLVAIEKGQRRVRIEELQKLCRLYGIGMNALLREESIHIDFEPQFRKLPQCKNKSAEEASKLLSDLVRAELELENLLGIKRVRNDPPEKSILSGNILSQAEHDALELRQWLGLGVGPIHDILTLLEMTVGIRVYIRKVDSQISGVFIYNPFSGPCILLNANHPKTRRDHTAIHELGHFITSRNTPLIFQEHQPENSREERYARAFARCFQMPARTVMQKFKEVTAGSNKLTRRHVIILSHYFGVSREALVRRLEELELVKNGTWDWFSNEGGISETQVKQVLGDRYVDHKNINSETTELRLHLLVAEVYRQEFLTEGQLARLLDINRVDLRKILDESHMEGSEDNLGTILPE